MNISEFPLLPERTVKPRQNGITMVMDKGIGLRQTEDLILSVAQSTDFVKLAFGTALITNNLKEKIQVLKENNIRIFLGGTLFEAFIVRDMFDAYRKYVEKLGLDTLEVSDGSIAMEHDLKCEYIHKLSHDYTVLSEVGSKESGILIAPGKWIEMMQKELQAGSWKVIGEARETGNVGIYRPTGKAHVSLVHKILTKVDLDKIIWEAPLKAQQVWFIHHFGSNVNLGNISPGDVIPLETLRLGLRDDTFFDFLPDELKRFQPKY
jgi:phosphosulfolactate synthase